MSFAKFGFNGCVEEDAFVFDVFQSETSDFSLNLKIYQEIIKIILREIQGLKKFSLKIFSFLLMLISK